MLRSDSLKYQLIIFFTCVSVKRCFFPPFQFLIAAEFANFVVVVVG